MTFYRMQIKAVRTMFEERLVLADSVQDALDKLRRWDPETSVITVVHAQKFEQGQAGEDVTAQVKAEDREQ